jgi:hypothetical protein
LFLFAKQTKPVKQEVNSTVILPPSVFPGFSFLAKWNVTISKVSSSIVNGIKRVDQLHLEKMASRRKLAVCLALTIGCKTHYEQMPYTS